MYVKNDILRKKDSFPQTVAESCNVLSKWTNQYEGKYNKIGLSQMMLLSFQHSQKRKNRRNLTKGKILHALGAREWGTTPASARKNC